MDMPSSESPQCAEALLAGHNLRRHQADVVHVGRLANIDHFGDVAKFKSSSPFTNITRSARLA